MENVQPLKVYKMYDTEGEWDGDWSSAPPIQGAGGLGRQKWAYDHITMSNRVGAYG